MPNQYVRIKNVGETEWNQAGYTAWCVVGRYDADTRSASTAVSAWSVGVAACGSVGGV